MVRLHVVAEGQTEELAVRHVFAKQLAIYSVITDVRSVETSRTKTRYRQDGSVPGQIYRGGILSYRKARGDLQRWMNEDTGPDRYFTTMFDLYALPTDFPNYEIAVKESDPYAKMTILEEAFAADVDHPRFIPYIQLHEFEALILSDPQKLDWEYLDHSKAIARLIGMAAAFSSPELINDHPETAPSKRIIKEIPAYAGQKSTVGPAVLERIPIDTLRVKCPHFRGWLETLEALV